MRSYKWHTETRNLYRIFKYWNKKEASPTLNPESSAFKGECHLLKRFFVKVFFNILKMSREGMEVMTNGFKIYQ